MRISTPSLIIDNSKMCSNILRMQSLADKNGINLRPHCKTHKSAELAKLQLNAGAIGITVAKLAEAEIMAEFGIVDILIANIIIGEEKLERLVALKEKIKFLANCVDSFEAAEMLNEAYKRRDLTGNVYIEINSGLNRCGLSDIDEILSLAQRIDELPALSLKGILTHGGHAYNARTLDEIAEIGSQESISMIAIANKLRKSGIRIDEISVGSTPTSLFCSVVKGISEIRPGNYIFRDMTQVSLGTSELEDCALSVLATVVSMPAKGRAVIDAGHKALGLDRCPPHSIYKDSFGYIIGKNASIVRLSEEHGVIEFENETFFIGEQVRIIPNHSCAVVNLHDFYFLEDKGIITRKINIDARGKMT